MILGITNMDGQVTDSLDTSPQGRLLAMVEKGRRGKWWKRKGSRSKGFKYFDLRGKEVVSETDLERIKSLVIPPAWRFVRISPSERSSLQAVGVDTTGRVQYKYHPKFSERQQKKKFKKIERFGRVLPKFRKVTNEHLSLDGFPREKVLAVMMRLINSLYIRVGSEKSVKRYKTFGITTLQNRHLTIDKKGRLVFDFVGKSHIKHRKILVDKELASVMAELKELGAAKKLFHYVSEEGELRDVKPADINAYIKEATEPDFSSKDFRTWGGTLLAALELAELGAAEEEKEAKHRLVKAVAHVAEELGNTPTVCRGSYIHPAVIDAYCKGITIAEFEPRRSRRIRLSQADYEPGEQALLKLLENGGNGRGSK
jgi:DNA topoisomerase-1